MGATAASALTTGAWGGDPARKQVSIAAARAALAAGPFVVCAPRLSLADEHRDWGNVYCTAYRTKDPAELEARAGLPVGTLMLASAALSSCDYYELADDGMRRRKRLAENALEAPIAALEAIPVGADTPALARSYVLDLLGRLERLRDLDGRGLTPEQRALPRRLATLHGEGSADPVAFRALRRTATAATDAATAEIEAAIMAFVESLAWPLAGLIDELPDIVQRGHQGLRAALAPERPTPVETAQMKAVDAMCDALDERRRAEPGFDTEPEVDRIQATPEFLAVIDLAFQVRLEHYDHLAAEAYAPFAIDLLLGAFRKA